MEIGPDAIEFLHLRSIVRYELDSRSMVGVSSTDTNAMIGNNQGRGLLQHHNLILQRDIHVDVAPRGIEPSYNHRLEQSVTNHPNFSPIYASSYTPTRASDAQQEQQHYESVLEYIAIQRQRQQEPTATNITQRIPVSTLSPNVLTQTTLQELMQYIHLQQRQNEYVSELMTGVQLLQDADESYHAAQRTAMSIHLLRQVTLEQLLPNSHHRILQRPPMDRSRMSDRNQLLFLLEEQNRPSQIQVEHNMSQVPRSNLPTSLAQPGDTLVLSDSQVFLRRQIEVFQATEEHVTTHIRGRNIPVVWGQVGIRCRHCAHIALLRHQKGSMYFPSNMLGIYQAAQNMLVAHIQGGLCQEMPDILHVQCHQHQMASSKSKKGEVGRVYWAKGAQELGLVDTEHGIRSIVNPSASIRPQSA
jgi:hypothetical protein